MIENVNPVDIIWEFTGPFTIVFNEKAVEKGRLSLASTFSKKDFFSVWNMYVSSAKHKICGLRRSDSHTSGILIKGIVFMGYEYIDCIVTADEEVLWEKKK